MNSHPRREEEEEGRDDDKRALLVETTSSRILRGCRGIGDDIDRDRHDRGGNTTGRGRVRGREALNSGFSSFPDHEPPPLISTFSATIPSSTAATSSRSNGDDFGGLSHFRFSPPPSTPRKERRDRSNSHGQQTTTAVNSSPIHFSSDVNRPFHNDARSPITSPSSAPVARRQYDSPRRRLDPLFEQAVDRSPVRGSTQFPRTSPVSEPLRYQRNYSDWRNGAFEHQERDSNIEQVKQQLRETVQKLQGAENALFAAHLQRDIQSEAHKISLKQAEDKTAKMERRCSHLQKEIKNTFQEKAQFEHKFNEFRQRYENGMNGEEHEIQSDRDRVDPSSSSPSSSASSHSPSSAVMELQEQVKLQRESAKQRQIEQLTLKTEQLKRGHKLELEGLKQQNERSMRLYIQEYEQKLAELKASHERCKSSKAEAGAIKNILEEIPKKISDVIQSTFQSQEEKDVVGRQEEFQHISASLKSLGESINRGALPKDEIVGKITNIEQIMSEIRQQTVDSHSTLDKSAKQQDFMKIFCEQFKNDFQPTLVKQLESLQNNFYDQSERQHSDLQSQLNVVIEKLHRVEFSSNSSFNSADNRTQNEVFSHIDTMRATLNKLNRSDSSDVMSLKWEETVLSLKEQLSQLSMMIQTCFQNDNNNSNDRLPEESARQIQSELIDKINEESKRHSEELSKAFSVVEDSRKREAESIVSTLQSQSRDLKKIIQDSHHIPPRSEGSHGVFLGTRIRSQLETFQSVVHRVCELSEKVDIEYKHPPGQSKSIGFLIDSIKSLKIEFESLPDSLAKLILHENYHSDRKISRLLESHAQKIDSHNSTLEDIRRFLEERANGIGEFKHNEEIQNSLNLAKQEIREMATVVEHIRGSLVILLSTLDSQTPIQIRPEGMLTEGLRSRSPSQHCFFFAMFCVFFTILGMFFDFLRPSPADYQALT